VGKVDVEVRSPRNMIIDQSPVPDLPPPTGGNMSNYDEEVDFYEIVVKILKPENEEASFV